MFCFRGIICTALLLAPLTAARAGEIVASGTGMALGVMDAAGQALSREQPDIKVNVLPSMGSGGGIKALLDGVLHVSFSARRLKEKEAETLEEKFCFLTALVLATNPRHVSNINLSDLPKLYADPSPYWPDGTPLKIILRADSGSEHPYLAKRVPGFAEALEKAKARSGVPTGHTDQINADIAERMEGALAITTLLQIRTEERKLAPASLDGVEANVATLRSGDYPFPIKVCVIAGKGAQPADVEAFLAHLKQPSTVSLFERFGAVPAE